MDAAADGECLVYSFGVGKDASFENSMADLGCRKGCQVSHDLDLFKRENKPRMLMTLCKIK